jgi:chemotaxis protein MotB
MIKKIALGLLIMALSTCVSKKIYTDLENKYTDLKRENRSLAEKTRNLWKPKSLELDQDA